MKKLLLGLLLSTLATSAWAQCGGPFANNAVCGNATGASTTARPTAITAFGSALFVNPTGTIGLTPVNGVATTGIRSDGAPALSQAIIPTWTGLHTFNTLPAVFGTSGYAWIGNGVSAASFQGFVPTVSNPSTRTWNDKADDFRSVLDFASGGSDVTRWTRAFAEMEPFYVTPGSYSLDTNPTYNVKAAQSVNSDAAVFSGALFSSCGSRLCLPLGASVSTTAGSGNLLGNTVYNVASTTGIQVGMMASVQLNSGTDGSLSTTACIPGNTTVVSVDSATAVTLSAALACNVGSGTNTYFQIITPTFLRGPYTHAFLNVSDLSLSSTTEAQVRQTVPLHIQQITTFAGSPGSGNQAPSVFIVERHTANTGVYYGSCGAGGCTGPTTTFNPLGGIQFAQNLYGDGSIQLINSSQNGLGTPAEGLQALLGWQGTQRCGTSSLMCQERVTELVQSDENIPAQQVGHIVRQTVENSTPGLDKRHYIASCGVIGSGVPCTSILSPGGFQAGGEFLSGLDFSTILTSGTSHFSTTKWARVSAGDGIYATSHGKGGLKYIYVVGNSAGRGCASPGTHVALSISGGGGASAAGNAILSTSGSVLVAYVTNEGSGYTSVPTISLAGCTVAPSFGGHIQDDRVTYGTSSTGITQISGGDTDASLSVLGTIDLMNANTGNIMVRARGSTGGGLQLYNGASAPTGTDKGAGTLNAAVGLYVANKSVPFTVASGTKALATSAISSGACSSAQTDTATGTLTTDTILATFNADPTGVTGYSPTVAGMLAIVAYPTADTVNFKVCNNTSASITPGAVSLNWRVSR